MGTFPVHELAQSPLVQAPFQTLVYTAIPLHPYPIPLTLPYSPYLIPP